MTGGPIVLTVEMTGEMTSTRSYNVRENDRRFDQWTNSSVDPSYLVSLSMTGNIVYITVICYLYICLKGYGP